MAIIIYVDCLSQTKNIYAPKESFEYVEFLYQTKQYDLAAKEYQRLAFLFPDSADLKVKLIECLLESGDYNLTKVYFSSKFKDELNKNKALAYQYVKLLFVEANEYNLLTYLNAETPFTPMEEQNIVLLSQMLNEDWESVKNFLDNNPEVSRSLKTIYEEYENLDRKSPFLAGALSSIIPGSGKIYSGSWKDGIVAFVFVGASAWQAYRGFSDKGIESAYGWIFGSISLGFYSGNIFGSVKAAKRYNKKLEHGIYHKVLHTSKNIDNLN